MALQVVPYFCLDPEYTGINSNQGQLCSISSSRNLQVPSVILATSSFGSLPPAHLSGAPRRRVEATRTAHRGRVRHRANVFHAVNTVLRYFEWQKA